MPPCKYKTNHNLLNGVLYVFDITKKKTQENSRLKKKLLKKKNQ